MVSTTFGSKPVRLFLFTTIFVVLVEGLLLAVVGRGPVLVVLPWADLTTEAFAILAALSIAYFCLGRWRVLDEPSTLWVGLAFWAYAIFAVMYLLVLPGVVGSGSVLNMYPNALGWHFHYMWTALALLLIISAFARWPHSDAGGRRYGRLLFAAIGLFCLLISALTFIFSANLPPMVVEGKFAGWHYPWIAAMTAMFILGAFLGLRQYLRKGQTILGYAATLEVVIAIRLASDALGGQFYDVAWYFNRVVTVGAFSLMLFTLLDEYVGLLHREQRASALAQGRASQLEATFDSIADAVFVLDTYGNVVDTNRRGVQLLGFASKDEALRPLSEYQQFLRASHLDGSPLLPEEYSGARALRGETLRGFLEQAHTPDGRELTLELSASPMRDASGLVTGAVVVIRDVTELEWARTRVTVARVATAVAQALSLDDLVAAVLNMAGAALQADMVTLYTVDEARRQLVVLGQLNVPPELLELTRIIHFDSPALTARAVTTGSVQVLEDLSRVPAELAIPREIGGRFGFRSLIAVPLLVRGHSIGAVTYAIRRARQFSPRELEAIGTIGDIIAVGLENARLYDEAQEERHRLTAVIESSPEAILLFAAPEGRLVLANKAAEQMVGHAIDHEAPLAEYPQLFGLHHPDGRLFLPAELPSNRAMKGEMVLGEEVLLFTPSGERVPFLSSAAPIRSAAGQVTGVVVTFQNIGHIKELERQREEFISVVAHDLKGAITILRGYSDLLLRPQTFSTLPPMPQKAVETIAGGTRRLARMIDDLLDVSRLEARRLRLEKRPLNLVDLVRDVVGRMEELTKGHVVTIDVKGSVPRVEADPDRIEQIMTNLLSNAGKYSYPDTPISVKVEPHPGEVIVSVTNEGPGIKPEDIPNLFTRFHRTELARLEKAPGLGLGLYITKGLVEAHGGHIWVEGEPGKYVTFRFALPAT